MNNNALLQEAAEKYASLIFVKESKYWFDAIEHFKDVIESDEAKQYYQQQQVSPVWVKASELKEIDWPLCVRFDGGGAPFYTTVCSMDELYRLTGEHNPIENIYFLDESKVLSDEDIEKLAEKEYDESYVYYKPLRIGFIKGYKAAKGML